MNTRAAGVDEVREPRPTLPFGEAVRVWVRVAALSFGGPAGQIAVMHRILVDAARPPLAGAVPSDRRRA